MAERRFTDLEIWKKSRKLRNEIYKLTRSFPKDEQYRLTDQILRSSRSITANIAEGHGRFHWQENIQFCRIARGSLSETLDHLICAFDIGLINETNLNGYESAIDELGKMLNGYINYLKRMKE